MEILYIEAKRNNALTMKINNLYVHSKYDPINEAKNIVSANFKLNHLHVLFGLGASHVANEIATRLTEDEALLIIEPNSVVVDNLRDDDTFKNMIHKDNVELINFDGHDLDKLKIILSTYIDKFMGRVEIIVTPNYDKLYAEILLSVYKDIKDVLIHNIVNNNTRNMFANEWQKNHILNLRHFYQSEDISVLFNKIHQPIVIASGGPSLEKQLELLKKFRKDIFLICAGSTLNTLLINNIKPDLLVTVDGGINNFNHFKDINLEEIPIAFPLILHHKILEKNTGQKYIFSIHDHVVMNNITNDLLNAEISNIQSGQSVANFSLNIALKLTSLPICLIGQDLAYTNHYTHSLGNKNMKKIDEEFINNRKAFYTEGYYGEDVLTDYVFEGMRKSFEQIIENETYSNEVFNCTEGGVKIKGFKQIAFSKFLNDSIDDKANENFLIENNDLIVKEIPSEFINKINKKILDYKELLEVLEKTLKLFEQYHENNDYSFHNLSEDLIQSDNTIKTYLNDQFLFYIVSPVIYKVNHLDLKRDQENDQEVEGRLVRKSTVLYTDIEHSVSKMVRWLEVLINKINNKEFPE
ncbi:hypothetical protein JMA_28230 [Jeotgalibacillus malaysiensis]|uniref:6-hydroxymethylpterin diphosphokinase MptE-like domain-containing protein n=1 Tax=Jeotgalibacillus malaysiensis TaxID=1508404 RepID=A0A0B5APE7_9BACL|nr:6-hydroxymethylpterin diphosphokinase MptE-like protein [Jeotgalibacillus malaysiensis]AJD92140.1 hypothetical protein JMA_28230 [Jeotgalibacillus malaysiensis]